MLKDNKKPEPIKVNYSKGTKGEEEPKSGRSKNSAKDPKRSSPIFSKKTEPQKNKRLDELGKSSKAAPNTGNRELLSKLSEIRVVSDICPSGRNKTMLKPLNNSLQ